MEKWPSCRRIEMTSVDSFFCIMGPERPVTRRLQMATAKDVAIKGYCDRVYDELFSMKGKMLDFVEGDRVDARCLKASF